MWLLTAAMRPMPKFLSHFRHTLLLQPKINFGHKNFRSKDNRIITSYPYVRHHRVVPICAKVRSQSARRRQHVHGTYTVQHGNGDVEDR